MENSPIRFKDYMVINSNTESSKIEIHLVVKRKKSYLM